MRTLEMGQLGDLSPQGSVAIGVIVALISTSLQAVGLTLQRKSHILEDEKYPYDLRRPPFKRRRWQVGMSMFVISNIVGSTIQITTLPLPVLSTLQASGLVFNTIFATLILGEPFTRYSLFGTILVCVGAIMIATFGAIGEPAHTLDQLLELLVRPAFIQWMIGTAVIVVVTILGARLLKLIASPSQTREWFLKCHLPHPTSFHSPRIKVLRGVLYGSVSGILSAHSLLVAKSAVELIVRTVVDRVNQFNRWQSWVILLGLVALALVQLYYMHRGLKLCSTSILYPYVFCIYNVIAILDGLIYFHQASRLSGLHAGLIALGTVILLSGVMCLSWRLEDVVAHQGPVSVSAAPGTPLAPGMGLLDEQSRPSYTDFGYPSDEESQSGERQPLLLHTPQQRWRSSSFSRTSPFHRRNTNPNIESAEIWAELRDDDKDDDVTGHQEQPLVHSALLPPPSPSSFRHFRKRHGRKSSTASGSSQRKRTFSLFGRYADNLPSNPLDGADKSKDDQSNPMKLPFRSPSRVRTWGPRRSNLQQPSDGNTWQRTSTPVVADTDSGQERSSNNVTTVDNGTFSPTTCLPSHPEINSIDGITTAAPAAPTNTTNTTNDDNTSRISALWNSATGLITRFVPRSGER